MYKYGFQPKYLYWTNHGEGIPRIDPKNVPSSSGHMDNDDPFTLLQHMVEDAFDHRTNDLQSIGDVDNEEEINEEPPNNDDKDFYDLLTTANRPLYEGASESKLSMSVKLMACKTNWNIPQKCLDFIASMLIDVCPSKDLLPNFFYQAEKLVSMLGLKYEKIDCCPNGCMLFYKDNSADRECRFCHETRYLPRKTGIGNYKDIPAKRMFYMPITPRLKRLYASVETSARMRWHHNRPSSGVLRHLSQCPCFAEFSRKHVSDGHNVSLFIANHCSPADLHKRCFWLGFGQLITYRSPK